MNGVSVLSVIENLADSAEGRMMEAVLEGMAEYYSANLAREVQKGLKENALKCMHTGGQPPLGYDVDSTTRKLIANEHEAKIVKIIFEMYADGSGYLKILDYLNGLGYKTKRGQQFGKNSLYSILRNEKYKGVYVFNRSSSAAPDGTRNSRKYKDDDEIIRIEGGVPALVDKDTFDRVQLKLQTNLKEGGRHKAREVYLLSGLTYCGECDSGMYGNTRTTGGRGRSRYSSYRCSDRVQYRGCENKELRREYLDYYVLDQLYERLFSDNSIKKLSAMLSEYNKKKTTESNDELNIYLKQLRDVNNKITSIINLVSESGVSISTVKDNLKQLEERKLFYEAQIKSIDEAIKMSVINENMIQSLVERSRDFVRAKNIPECRNFIENYVKKVLVYSDRVEVIFKIHVPSDDDDTSVVPLTSHEVIKTLQREHRGVAKSK